MTNNVEIKNIGTCILGTVKVEIKAEGHRGFQEFIFCPADKLANNLFIIQSDKRIGQYNAETGEIKLSKSRALGSYNIHLMLDRLVRVKVCENDRQTLNKAITGSANNTGNDVIKIDNSRAASIFGL